MCSRLPQHIPGDCPPKPRQMLCAQCGKKVPAGQWCDCLRHEIGGVAVDLEPFARLLLRLPSLPPDPEET